MLFPPLTVATTSAARLTRRSSPPPDRRSAPLVQRAFQREYSLVAWTVVEASVAIWRRYAGRERLVDRLRHRQPHRTRLGSCSDLATNDRASTRAGFRPKCQKNSEPLGRGYHLCSPHTSWLRRPGSSRGGLARHFRRQGLIVTMFAIPVMCVLARQKIAITDLLGSRAKLCRCDGERDARLAIRGCGDRPRVQRPHRCFRGPATLAAAAERVLSIKLACAAFDYRVSACHACSLVRLWPFRDRASGVCAQRSHVTAFA
jgi:hypothetical protein